MMIFALLALGIQLAASDNEQSLALHKALPKVLSDDSGYESGSESDPEEKVVQADISEALCATVCMSLIANGNDFAVRTSDGFLYARRSGRVQTSRGVAAYSYFGSEDGNGTYIFETGTIAQREASGLVRTLFSNGAIHESYPDGSKKNFHPDGTKIDIGSNGVVYKTFLDGAKHTLYQDGTREVLYADGSKLKFDKEGELHRMNSGRKLPPVQSDTEL